MTQPYPSPDELADLCHAVFSADVRGRAILEHLERRYCRAAPVVTNGGIDAILTTYQRAAHREVLDYIHALIARAERPHDETPTAAMKG